MRSLSIALCGAILVCFTPVSDAAETWSEPYVAGGPHLFGLGAAVTIENIDLDQDGRNEVPDIGGTFFDEAGQYQNAVVRALDEVYGTDVALRVCFAERPDEDDVTNEIHCGPAGCGTQTLFGNPFDDSRLRVAVFGVLVTEDLVVCGASSGTVTADVFGPADD